MDLKEFKGPRTSLPDILLLSRSAPAQHHGAGSAVRVRTGPGVPGAAAAAAAPGSPGGGAAAAAAPRAQGGGLAVQLRALQQVPGEALQQQLPTPQEPHQQTPRNPYQRMLRNPPDRPPGNPNLRPPPRAPGRRAWAGWYLSGAPELGAGGGGQRGSPGLCGADTRAPGTSFSRQGPDLHLPDSSLLAHPPPLYSSGSLNSYLLTFLTTTYPETIKKYLHGLVTPVGPRQEGI
ncbi:proline-rich proteoglycan 2 isoform X1 [Canis lupus familiaris]|uniref:proline-rich proteoglycan 2 isoform X1 n=1 Tax=Canis lupus familiaris TaxID=9615 RepID=UPI000BAA1301|nr:proline-rich proteoglycan 2 isoform X1 [Canis lupus familiaris]XP_038403079.1 proline-rich proteoglycan 2 isoform X1 [Canis lupus familiaris]XP_038532231.1 proline-rich proteoglycan 2 isoform X1 [Canis lupus familiaris]XP_048969978.1 proline-rich proteoglycan 2-like isoform X1 [Canis lupus dingo]|eukprot:XP_022278623.1 proline-rich proteoglycan 2 isoform X1 [Canis lupus familiaris]